MCCVVGWLAVVVLVGWRGVCSRRLRCAPAGIAAPPPPPLCLPSQSLLPCFGDPPHRPWLSQCVCSYAKGDGRFFGGQDPLILTQPFAQVGGCCVCSDEQGWNENPLVYCDGQGCSVAVHQGSYPTATTRLMPPSPACYGIVTVPTGPWYCRKCESQERQARVRCELCPSKDGALKRTDNGGWAHVVCALYIPEVRFGNVATMEPIILALVPQERYNKVSRCRRPSHNHPCRSATSALRTLARSRRRRMGRVCSATSRDARTPSM